VEATSSPNEWHGTTTACGALLHHTCKDSTAEPMLYITNLGDSQILVIRPKDQEVIFKTTEQWHWFDCPRQLGTNSPDTPLKNAVMDKLALQEDDVVLAMSDGVVDNLWEHEVLQNVLDSIRNWKEQSGASSDRKGNSMQFVAQELVNAARVIAEDPFAESPFMERAVEEGLAMEGGEDSKYKASLYTADW
jgi:serine/threonine protein phosphatase PrpC